MTTPPDPLAESLAAVRESLDLPPGVVLAVMRLPRLDPLIERLEDEVDREGSGSPGLAPVVVDEIERTVDLLSGTSLGSVPDAIARRFRLVEVLRLATGGPLPAVALDRGDAFGADLATILATDADLGAVLGRVHPLVIRATSVAPGQRWLADARTMATRDDASETRSVVGRALATLLRAEITSRPDLLIGGVRLANQRLARGLLWILFVVDPAPAELLGAVGARMGTSGRNDAVVRDVALANTCAALLGESGDPQAGAALASMRVRITNRNVLRQVDRALEAVAARRGVPVETVIEMALPAFGLDASGRLERTVGRTRAIVEIGTDGAVATTWISPDGGPARSAPAHVETSHPAEVASIRELAASISSTLSEERRRMEERLASEREWPEAVWRERFRDHPIGAFFGRRLIWTIRPRGSAEIAAVPDGDGWLTIDGRRLAPDLLVGSAILLWHPADADDDIGATWTATLAIAGIRQPIRQADREVFRPLEHDREVGADRRFAGRVVDHAQMRALLRQRGWSVPALGAWDQGDEATAWRSFDAGLHAELRYQTAGREPAGGPPDRARLIGLRFAVVGPGGNRGQAETANLRSLGTVPSRVFSEALRDVSLVVVVGDRNDLGG